MKGTEGNGTVFEASGKGMISYRRIEDGLKERQGRYSYALDSLFLIASGP